MPDIITNDERRMIDEHIAKRGVTKIQPTWCAEIQQQPPEENKKNKKNKKRNILFSGVRNGSREAALRRRGGTLHD